MSDSPTHSFDAFLSYATRGDFLLVVAALNERPSLNWREFFDSLRLQPWMSRLAVVVLWQRGYRDELEIQDDGVSCPWILDKFNDHELDEALAKRGRRREEFDTRIIGWMVHTR